MRLINFLKERGFTLTETLVAMGLLGGVSLVTMRLMENSASNESYLRFRSEVSKATAIITTHLNDPNSCKSIIVGKTPVGTPVPVPVTSAANYYNGDGILSMLDRRGVNNVILLRHNTDYDGFRIPLGGISLQRNQADTPTQKLFDLMLVFDIKRRDFSSRKAGTNERIVKKITIKAQANGTTLTSCAPVAAEASLTAKKVLCDSLMGAASWDGTECRLRAIKCPFGQVPFEMTSLGSVKCIPITRRIDLDQVFDFVPDTCLPGQQVRLIPGADNKIKVDCF